MLRLQGGICSAAGVKRHCGKMAIENRDKTEIENRKNSWNAFTITDKSTGQWLYYVISNLTSHTHTHTPFKQSTLLLPVSMWPMHNVIQ